MPWIGPQYAMNRFWSPLDSRWVLIGGKVPGASARAGNRNGARRAPEVGRRRDGRFREGATRTSPSRQVGGLRPSADRGVQLQAWCTGSVIGAGEPRSFDHLQATKHSEAA